MPRHEFAHVSPTHVLMQGKKMPHAGASRVDDSPENVLWEHFRVLVDGGKIYSPRDMEVRGKTAKEQGYIGSLHSLLFGIVNSSTLSSRHCPLEACVSVAMVTSQLKLFSLWMCRQ